jgi:L-lysine 2,3-aminomutase
MARVTRVPESSPANYKTKSETEKTEQQSEDRLAEKGESGIAGHQVRYQNSAVIAKMATLVCSGLRHFIARNVEVH